MSDEIDWSLLPYRAKEFFGLPAEFDRKTLKRAYNKLIRQFKPEKFPAEFKKIRAAFEMLEGELRYGVATVNAASSFKEYTWQPTTVAAGESAAPAEISQPKRKSVRERLGSESPISIYKDLKAQPTKTPYDFFALATLSDVVADDATLYLKWLLTGLQEHPNDPGLMPLLQHFFHQDLDASFLRSCLFATSKIVSNDRFYFVTEKGWQRLLRIEEFPQFRHTLAQCESNLKDHRNDMQLVFYSELLKAAIWKADPQWLQQKFALLEGDAGRMGMRLEQELFLLDQLREYHLESASFTRGCPVRTALHNTIVDYYSCDEQEGDAKVIACQNEIGSNAQALLGTFNDDEELESSNFMLLWYSMNEDVSQRHGFRTGCNLRSRKVATRYMKRLNSLVQDLDETWQFSTRHILTWFGLHWGSYLLMIVTPLILMGSWLSHPAILIGSLVAAIIGVVLNKMFIFPRTVKPQFDNHIERTVQKSYEEHWRGRFVQFFDATGSNRDQLVQSLVRIMENDEDFGGAMTWLPPILYADMGLMVYSMTVPYRR